MFLDDKLQQAHEEHPANYQLFFDIIMQHIVATAKRNNTIDNRSVVVLIKQADNSYRLFAKRNGLDTERFRSIYRQAALEASAQVGNELLRKLGW